MGYADKLAAAQQALTATGAQEQCWRFWFYDGHTLRPPFVASITDQAGRDLPLFTGTVNTAPTAEGFHYLPGTDRFINLMRGSFPRFLDRAADRDNAAIVTGTVTPRGVIGRDPDPRQSHGMRARTLAITHLFIIHPGRHTNLRTRLSAQYLVPVTTRSIWEPWP